MCEVCGRDLVKRKNESRDMFAARRYCSKRCAGIATNPRVPDEDFAAPYRKIKTPDGRNMLEHRWVMEQAIGRPLLRQEQVHHKNRNRLDNRIENLELVSTREHGLRHTVLPTQKTCEVCGSEYVPHKTKRRRSRTCSPGCARSLAWSTRRANSATTLEAA